MEPFLKDVLTLGLSGLSLIVSIVALINGILISRREKGVLKFSLEYEKRNTSGAILLKIENKGFHSIKINQIRMVVKNRVINIPQKSFELDYGENEIVKILLTGHKNFHPSELKRLEVVDIEDKVYKIGVKQIKSKIRR